MLVAGGAALEALNLDGMTPLHVVESGDWANATAVGIMLVRGAAVDPSNAKGETPLILAVQEGIHQTTRGIDSRVRGVKRLLEAGAAPTRREHSGCDARAQARAVLIAFETLRSEAAADSLPSIRYETIKGRAHFRRSRHRCASLREAPRRDRGCGVTDHERAACKEGIQITTDGGRVAPSKLKISSSWREQSCWEPKGIPNLPNAQETQRARVVSKIDL